LESDFDTSARPRIAALPLLGLAGQNVLLEGFASQKTFRFPFS
jgi:hypothetical protein